jgi:hypothetical protein
MKKTKETAASVWDWTLVVLPFTAFITFIVILTACNLVSNYVPSGGNLLQISHIGSGNAYVYFIAGVVMLVPQVIAIIIGRLQFLLETQAIINKILLYIIHIITLIPFIFMIIVALVSRGQRYDAQLVGTYGIFGSIALYCFVHTIAVFYLYIRRTTGSQYSEVILPIWFLVCNLLLVIFFVVWLNTNSVITGYIAAATPFLYFLGFVRQFWARARSRKRYAAVSRVSKILNG